MIKLFRYEGYKISIEPEALLLKPFKQLWNRDKTVNKEKALLELGYIYFMCDPRSDYQYITDNQLRSNAVKEGEGLPSNWKPDKLVQEAMEFFLSFKSMSVLLLEDTKCAVDKLRALLRDIKLDETDDRGKPIYTLNVITATIKLVPSLAKDLDAAEKAIASELIEFGKMRGQGLKSVFEDSLDD